MAKLSRRVSSAGRATALQAVGHRFEPYTLHQKNLVLRNEIFLFKPQAWHIIDAQSAAHIITPSACISKNGKKGTAL